MFGRDSFLRVHGVDPVKWAKRWDLEPFSYPCACGETFTTTIPIARGALRGLIAPRCACGNNDTPYCVVSADGGDVLGLLPKEVSDEE